MATHEVAQSVPDLPREVSRGTINIFGFEVVVVQLDDGRRIFEAESCERLLNAMVSGGLDLKNVTPMPESQAMTPPNPDGETNGA